MSENNNLQQAQAYIRKQKIIRFFFTIFIIGLTIYIMKKLIIFLLALNISGLWAQSQELNIPLSNPGKKGELEVNIHRGTVEVVASNREDVLVRYESLSKHKNKVVDAGDGMKKISGGGIKLGISERDNEVHVSGEHNSQPVALVIEVPTSFDLHLSTHHIGHVKVQGVEGEVVIEGHHGDIEAKDITGSVVADTWHGNILVTFKDVNTDASLAFTTYHGKVDLGLPNNMKAKFKMRSTKGEIFTGFDIDLTREQSIRKERQDDGTYQVSLGDWVTGQINGGGTEIQAQTHHGNIYIRKQ